MKSWTAPPSNAAGRPIGGGGTRRKPVVITAASTRSSSKLATHSGRPPNRK